MNLPFKHCDLYNTIITSEKQDRKEREIWRKGQTPRPFHMRQEKNILATAMETESLCIMALAPLIILIIFKYVPMYGILIAFKNYKASKGVWGSNWLEPVLEKFY